MEMARRARRMKGLRGPRKIILKGRCFGSFVTCTKWGWGVDYNVVFPLSYDVVL